MISLPDIAAKVPGYRAVDLPVESARQFIASLVDAVLDEAPWPAPERLATRDALGRVLAQDLVSPIDVPAQDNAAMDGYAVRSADLADHSAGNGSGSGLVSLPVAGVSLAGRPFVGPVPAGHAVRIMTGAVLPVGLDTVVPQEMRIVSPRPDAATAGTVELDTRHTRTGDHCRRRGEDLACGQTALPGGRRLTPADLGLIASLGRAEVSVRARLKVAYFSSGDELRTPGEPLGEGGVYDSNGHTLRGMLQTLGCEVIDLGIVRDEPSALHAALQQAAAGADAVVTSGGVSQGDADQMRRVMGRLGEVVSWQLAMRPGRPMAVGCIARSGPDGERRRPVPLFALPGNPVATMVSFYAFVRDALLRLNGALSAPMPMLRAVCSTPLRKRPGRTEFQRGIVGRGDDGAWQVRITGAQGSGILSSMSLANGLVVLPPEQGDLRAGDAVDVLPFEGLM